MKSTLGSREADEFAINEYRKGTLLHEIQSKLSSSGLCGGCDTSQISAVAHAAGLPRRLIRKSRKFQKRLAMQKSPTVGMNEVEELISSNLSKHLKMKLLKDLVKDL